MGIRTTIENSSSRSNFEEVRFCNFFRRQSIVLMSSKYETELWLLRLFPFKIIILLGRRPTGRTQDFGSCNRGSNPRAPVSFFCRI